MHEAIIEPHGVASYILLMFMHGLSRLAENNLQKVIFNFVQACVWIVFIILSNKC